MDKKLIPKKFIGEVIENSLIAVDIMQIWIRIAELNLSQIIAGQFLAIYSSQRSNLLPRPLSIHDIDLEQQKVCIVYKVVGEVTRELASKKAGEEVNILGPLGNGFTLNNGNHLIIGGGIGIAPLYFLCKKLEGKKTIILGFRDEPFLINQFKALGNVVILTDTGSYGIKGTIDTYLDKFKDAIDFVYACGPSGLLQEVVRFSRNKKIGCEVSIEERMACGLGVCLGCVHTTIDRVTNQKIFKRVCKEGPVFTGDEVYWE